MQHFVCAALKKIAKAIVALVLIGSIGLLAACGGSGSTAALTSISVGPPDSSLAVGVTQQFGATGVYSDGSKKDLSAGVTWSSSSTAVATTTATGMVTALTPGSTTITATLNGVSGTTTLTVTPATLVSIGIAPATATLANGTHRQFTAMGVYSDNSSHDVTSMVTWSSSNTAIASVSNTAGSNGLVTALAVGSISIGATLTGVAAPSVTVTVTAATLVSIGITPASPSVALGLTRQFTATGTYTDNSTQNITNSVTWSSDNTAVAQISNASGSNGLATALAVGSAHVTAALSAVSSAPVTLTVTSATLVSIAVTPASPSIALGLTQQFTATGTYSDNSTQNLTAAVMWNSSDPTVAPISNASGSSGLATTLQTGSVSVTATLGAVVSPDVTLTVTSATLVSIAVTPASPSIALGLTKQFTATGTYTDNSTQNITNSVTWSSDNTAVAQISNASGSNGLATALAVGSAHVTAALSAVSSAPVTLTVTSATLVSIAVTPASPSIALGLTQQFTATGTYTDNSTQNITNSVTWSSDNTAVAQISNASGSNGLATALAVGSAHVTAALSAVSSAPVTLTVTSATLVSIAVTPTAPSIAVLVNQQFTATGTYTDSSTQNITNSVTWSSDNTAVAQISNASGSNGLATALAVGSANISAALGSVLSPAVTLSVTAPTETVLYSLANSGGDGANPIAGLVQGSDGNFYGTTSNGGTSGVGTVFNITPAGVETVLYSFTGTGGDGANPQAGLIQGSDGNLYGTTDNGGTGGVGTVFKITPAGVETALYSFTGTGGDGANPFAGLIQGSDGNFYGTTFFGGTSGVGTVFKITPAGVETVLYSFTGTGGDGANPQAGLIQGSDGNFYGTTSTGGTSGIGTVFNITPAGVETVLYSFMNAGGDGANPYAGLIQGSDGNFYGTTFFGGASGDGTVFNITPAGVETVLYSFTNTGGDGANPIAGLIQASDGNFYGTTQFGGTSGAGTVFNITPAGVETALYSFTNAGGDGANPQAGLIQGSDGNLYGTTDSGGTGGVGTVFRY